MEDNKLLDKIEKKIIQILKKEGGAAGLAPLKKATDKMDQPKDFDLKKTLKKTTTMPESVLTSIEVSLVLNTFARWQLLPSHLDVHQTRAGSCRFYIPNGLMMT